MNTKVKIFSYLLTTFCLLACIYEAIYIYTTKIPPYALDFNYKKVFKNSYLSLCLNIGKVFMNYLITYLINFDNNNSKTKNDESENDANSPKTIINDSKNDPNNPKTFTEIIKRFLSKNNILIATYIFCYMENENYFFRAEDLYLPFIFYIFMLLMYNYFKYFCGLTRATIYIGYFLIYTDYLTLDQTAQRFKKTYNEKNAIHLKKKLEDKFMYDVQDNNLEFFIKPTRSGPLNVVCYAIKNLFIVEVNENISDFMNKEQFTSVLYHELKHIIIQKTSFEILPHSQYIILLAAECLLIYLSKNIFKNGKCSSKNCIKVYLFLNVTLGVIFKFTYNLFRILEELDCDKFSVLNNGKQNLISALIILHKLSNTLTKNSFLYNLMYLDHPNLDYRIKYIKNV